MKKIIYVILGVILLIGIGLYVYMEFNAKKISDSNNPLQTKYPATKIPSNVLDVSSPRNYTISYGEAFSTPNKFSILVFPEFYLRPQGIISQSNEERDVALKAGTHGLMLVDAFRFSFTYSDRKEIVDVRLVPWGWKEFEVLGKKFTIQIVGFDSDNPALPQFVVTEGRLQTVKSNFVNVHHVSLDLAKSENPNTEYFKPNIEETYMVLEVLENWLIKTGYAPAQKLNVDLVGVVDESFGRKQVRVFMWEVGSPLENRYKPEKEDSKKEDLTSFVQDGGPVYIDAIVDIEDKEIENAAPHYR